jgi:hypothetical protein
MMNQDDLMFEYLISMGAMRPEEMELMRKQKQIDALRAQSAESPQGQMIGKHYVAPSVTQGIAQMFSGYAAGQAQKKQEEAMRGMNTRQASELKRMRDEMERRRRMKESGGMGPSAMYQGSALPYGDGPVY